MLNRFFQRLNQLPNTTETQKWVQVKNDLHYCFALKEELKNNPLSLLALQIEANNQGIALDALLQQAEEKTHLLEEVNHLTAELHTELQRKAVPEFAAKLKKKRQQLDEQFSDETKKAELATLKKALILEYADDEKKQTYLSTPQKNILAKLKIRENNPESKYESVFVCLGSEYDVLQQLVLHKKTASLDKKEEVSFVKEDNLLQKVEWERDIYEYEIHIRNPASIIIGSEDVSKALEALFKEKLSETQLKTYHDKMEIWVDLFNSISHPNRSFVNLTSILRLSQAFRQQLINNIDEKNREDKQRQVEVSQLSAESDRVSQLINKSKEKMHSPSIAKLRKLAGSSAVGARVKSLKDPQTYHNLHLETARETKRMNNQVMKAAWEDENIRNLYDPSRGCPLRCPSPTSADAFLADMKNSALNTAVSQNAGLSIAIAKYQAMKKMNASLNSQKSIPERLSDFHKDFLRAVPVLKQNRDSAGMRFLKYVGAFFGGAILLVPTLGIGSYFFAKSILQPKSAQFVEETVNQLMPK